MSRSRYPHDQGVSISRDSGPLFITHSMHSNEMASMTTGRSPMGASLEDLPCEVTLEIMSHLRDLRSLYNLVVAAPVASRIFDEFGPEIVEHVLANSITPELLTAPRIPHIVRLVARIRQSTPSTPPAPNFASFLDSYMRRKEKDFGTMEPGPLAGLSMRVTLSDSPDGLSARQLLILARRIASLAVAGFDFFLDRCTSVDAEHLADPSSEYRQPPSGFPWRERFEGRPYRPASGGPPSWYEMQHMTRGLWNLQMIYELRNAATEGRLGWTARDVEQIHAMDVSAWFGHPTVHSEEVLTALYYIHHLEGKPLAGGCTGHPFSTPSTGPLGAHPLRLPTPPGPGPGPGRGTDDGVWPADVAHPPRGDFRARFGFEAFGYKWALLLSQNVRSPIRTVSFRPFRALGFGLWDRQRLAAFGLVHPPGDLAMAPKTSGDFFAWRSWLDAGAREEVEAWQEGEWRSGRLGGILRITGWS